VFRVWKRRTTKRRLPAASQAWFTWPVCRFELIAFRRWQEKLANASPPPTHFHLAIRCIAVGVKFLFVRAHDQILCRFFLFRGWGKALRHGLDQRIHLPREQQASARDGDEFDIVVKVRRARSARSQGSLRAAGGVNGGNCLRICLGHRSAIGLPVWPIAEDNRRS